MYVANPTTGPIYTNLPDGGASSQVPPWRTPAVFARSTTTTTADGAPLAAPSHWRSAGVISPEGQESIDGHLRVLADCGRGRVPKASGKELMNAYYTAIIEHDPCPDRVEMAKSLEFLKDANKFGDNHRTLALDEVQRQHEFGVGGPNRAEEILERLKSCWISKGSSFVASMRRAWPEVLFNGNTMKALHEAACKFVKDGGQLFRVHPDKAGAFLDDLVQRHVSDPATRRSLEVMLKRPKGYVEQLRGNEIVVLHNPDAPATAQLAVRAAQEFDRALLQQPSASQKRGAASLDLPDATGAAKRRVSTLSDAPDPPLPQWMAGDDASWRPFHAQSLSPTGGDWNAIPIEFSGGHGLPSVDADAGGIRHGYRPPLRVVEHRLSSAPSLLARPPADEIPQDMPVQSRTVLGAAGLHPFYEPQAEEISSDSDSGMSNLRNLFEGDPCPGWIPPVDVHDVGGGTATPPDAPPNPLTLSTPSEQAPAPFDTGASLQAMQPLLASTDDASKDEQIRDLIEYLKAPPTSNDRASGVWDLWDASSLPSHPA